MNIRKIVSNLDYNKILTFVVAAVIIVYLIITVVKENDFSIFKEQINNAKKDLVNTEILSYLESRADYYYPIEGESYCISKEELSSSGAITNTTLDSINTNYVYAIYESGNFNIAFLSECGES